MTSGIPLYTESGQANGLRAQTPVEFSSDFLFRNTMHHPLPQLQLIPEKILEFFVSPEGFRYYKVQWQHGWVPEHQLLQYHSIIEGFWQSHNVQNLPPNSADTDQPSKQVAISGKQEQSWYGGINEKLPKIQGPKESIPTFQSTFKLVNSGSTTVSPVLQTPSVKDVAQGCSYNINEKSYEDVGQVAQPSTSFMESVQTLVNAQPIGIRLGDDDADLSESEMISDSNSCEDGNQSEDHEDAEATQPKLNELTTIECDDFSIMNVENNSVSEEDIRIQAREVLTTFKNKGPRCPNGSSKLPHACFFCTKVLSSRKKLREHQFSIHFKNVGDFNCEICKQRFAFRRKLKAHMITHSDSRSYVCEVCGLTCKRRTHLLSHMETHNKERNFRCDVCHKNFKVQAELKTHCLNEHKNQTTTCNVCKQKLLTGYSVYIHSLQHSGTRDFSCDVCNATFKSKHHLTAHVKIHTGYKKLKCPGCEEEFSEKKYLRNHIEVHHAELAVDYKSEYMCTICDKDFAYKGLLNEHMKTHAEETPAELNTRLKSSRKKKVESMSEDDLKKLSDRMERIIHAESGDIKLKCKLCPNREFRLIGSMEKHLAEHEAGTIDKVLNSFECNVCNKVLTSEGHLMRHTRTHETGTSKKQNTEQPNNSKRPGKRTSKSTPLGQTKEKGCIVTEIEKRVKGD